MTMRKLKGVPQPEPYAACSGCIQASFQFSGRVRNVTVVSNAPVHPAGTVDLDAHLGGVHETPIENPQKLPPKVGADDAEGRECGAVYGPGGAGTGDGCRECGAGAESEQAGG
jgi:hypothetical protein